MFRLSLLSFVCGLGFVLLSHGSTYAQSETPQKEETKAAKVEKAKLGDTRNVHRCGELFLAGQPTKDDVEIIKKAGIKHVITLRTEGEIEWDEAADFKKAGLDFTVIPFRKPDSLTDQVFDDVRKALRKETPTLLHCGSANRVGAVWFAFRVLDQKVDAETAMKEAKEIGLRNEGYEKRARDYVTRNQKPKKSINPGINESFRDTDLNPEDWIKRFEIESREVYSARREILKACQINEGWTVADIGAGTGLYTRQFSQAVGNRGWVYAVDISPRFLEHINSQSERRSQTNVTAVLCRDTSVDLPPNSVDLAFICDTYHHFEYPAQTLASIHRALKDDGVLIVIDFERIEGKTREWLMNHVRAGKSEFRAEVEAAKFKFVAEVDVPGLEENYFLRFKKN